MKSNQRPFVKPKKKLGQHFLKDELIAKRIVDSFDASGKSVVEIGPGMGVLTKHLLGRNNFIAADVDDESIEYLKRSFPENSKCFELLDFLKMDLAIYDQGELGIIGNFPYNISSQIFFKVFENRNKVDEVVGMIQKEVADRIASKSGNKVYGILSVLLQAFYEIDFLFAVGSESFIPPPKVESAVIRLKRNKVESLPCDEKLFKRVVKLGFGKRRKTLRNALKELNLSEDLVSQSVFSRRAEQLTVQDFISLTSSISDNG